MISADALLADVAALTPSERLRRVVQVARRLPADSRTELLADLGARDRYARQLAVTMAAATSDAAHLAAALRDPYPQVRSAALAAKGMPEEAVAGFIADAPLTARLEMYKWLRRGRRAALADRLLPQVRERWGDGEAARLLVACSPPTVRVALEELAYAVTGWSALTARHPEIVVGHVDAELAALGMEAWAGWWLRSGGLVSALARHRPADLLDLWERRLVGPLPPGHACHLGRLLGVDPARVVRLLLADPIRARHLAYWTPGAAARDRLAAEADSDLGALLRAAGPDSAFSTTVLRRLRPSCRSAVFDLAYAGRELAAELLPDEILRLLPHERRYAEARRMLALPAVAEHHTRTWSITAFLPWAQARPVLTQAARGANADDRAHAYTALVRCAALSAASGGAEGEEPAVVAELLADLARIRNERDPVRSPVLTALATHIRPDLYDASCVAALDELVRGAMDARDCSGQTRTAVHRLVFGVLARSAAASGPELLEWALDTVERLAAWQHFALSGASWRQLRRGQEREVVARLAPWLAKALDGNQAYPVLDIAAGLGRRAWDLPELQDLLHRATKIKNDGVVRRAVALWLAPPRDRCDRAAGLVATDKSLVTLPQVLTVIVRHRTDLLDDLVLSGRPLRGRFGTKNAQWVPVIERGALLRWTPAQVRRYADLLVQAIGEPGGSRKGLDRAGRATLVRALAALPDSGQETVRWWVDDDDVLLAEAALAGLAHSDRPDVALPVLLGNAHGDRARVAVYAAARCAREIAPSRLADLLTEELATAPKITARKEAARLLAATRPDGALEALLAAWHREGQHRDVRVAVVTALRGAWLDDERVWPVLEAAASDGERALAESLLAVRPTEIAVRHRRRYASLLRRLTRHAEPLVVQAAYSVLAWPTWTPAGAGADELRADLLDDLVRGMTDLGGGPNWRQALTAVATPAMWTTMPELLPTIAAALVDAARADADAEPLRDLPARQRLDRLVTWLCDHGDAAARRHPEPVIRVAAVLAADPTFVPLAARLHAALAWPGPDFADRLTVIADLLRDLPVTAASIHEHLAVYHWEAEDVAAAVDTVAARGDLAGGLIAVRLAEAVNERAGWPEPWRARIRALRRHPEPEVRHAARTVFTADE